MLKEKESQLQREKEILEQNEKSDTFSKEFLEQRRKQIKKMADELILLYKKQIEARQPKPKRKTASIQKFAGERVEAEEGTGSYMASVDRQVDEHFQRIKGTTKEMKEQLAEVKAQASEREIEKDDQNKQSEEQEMTREEETEKNEEIENKAIEEEETEKSKKHKEEGDNQSVALFTDKDSSLEIISDSEKERKTKKYSKEIEDLFKGDDDSEALEDKARKRKRPTPKKTFHRKAPGGKFGEKNVVESSSKVVTSSESSDDEKSRSRPRKRQVKRRKRQKSESSSDRRVDPDYQPSDNESDEENTNRRPETRKRRSAADLWDSESTDGEKDKTKKKTTAPKKRKQSAEDKPEDEPENDEETEETAGQQEPEKKKKSHQEPEKKKKREVKNPGKHSRAQIKCPRCEKLISKSAFVLKRHYSVKHKMVPHAIRDDEIGIATKRSHPKRKDGTRSTDITAKTDKRNRRRTCTYCAVDFSISHLRGDHLRPDSDVRCDKIPKKELEDLKTDVQKKAWTAEAIKKSSITAATAPKTRTLFAGDTYYKVDDLLEVVYKRMISIHGKFYVEPAIKEKKRKGKRLTPEEHKKWYRPQAIRHQQKRVLDHIFGDREFQMKDIGEVGKWMLDEEDEVAFFNSRLVRLNKDVGREEPLTYSTINSLALAVLEVLKFVQNEFEDREVKTASAKAIAAIRCVAKNADKRSRHLSKRKGFLEPNLYLIPINEISKFCESKKHKAVMQKATDAVKVMKDTTEEGLEDLLNYLIERYSRNDIYELQCQVAVLLTMQTGKRPGVICAIRNIDVQRGSKNLERFHPEKNPEQWVYRIRVAPSCIWAKFKTVEVAYVCVKEKMLDLLRLLGLLRRSIDRSREDDDRLITSYEKHALTDIDDQMKKAWKDCGLTSRFNSTMIRHTIVTRARDPKKNLSVDELVALARGMDHSVRTAELRYAHEKEKRQTEISKLINDVLELNGNENGWMDEMAVETEEGYEKDVMTGEVQLIDSIRMTDDENEEDEEGRKQRKVGTKVGSSEVKYTTKQTQMVRNMFEAFIAERVEKEDPIVTRVMEEIYDKNMQDVTANDPFAELFQFTRKEICTKVRTLITQDKRKKHTKDAHEQKQKDPQKKTAGGKGKGKGKSSTPKL